MGYVLCNLMTPMMRLQKHTPHEHFVHIEFGSNKEITIDHDNTDDGLCEHLE
jgi:hypothetical protein